MRKVSDFRPSVKSEHFVIPTRARAVNLTPVFRYLASKLNPGKLVGFKHIFFFPSWSAKNSPKKKLRTKTFLICNLETRDGGDILEPVVQVGLSN